MALTTKPRVLAILVVHDGGRWLPDVLAALRRQTYPELDVVAVDNGSSDASRDLLLAELEEERVLVAERDLGFPAAVSMALDSAVAAGSEASWLLLVHDDLVLDPDAVECLVTYADADARLAVVGPKLLQYDNPRLLQQVGWSIDASGRPDSGLEPDEVDQGQRDRERPVLYVSTAGMLVRRSVFDAIGRFDRRYHVFREDLDLCWRLWLGGHDVEVVPAAVGRHVRAASNYRRLGFAARRGPRYFAERNTLSTLLKCYGRARLATVLPVFFVVSIAKLLGFLVTRRFSDAWQTVRAWGWNLVHLRETLRLRVLVQAGRVRSDAELRPLFTRIAPRLRAYVEAVADRITGGDEDIPPPDAMEAGQAPPTYRGRVVAVVARHPVLVVTTVLTLVGLMSALPLLASGSLRGGDFAPWPVSPMAFLRAYASAWNDTGGLGSAAPVSPAQAVLGLLNLLILGSTWLGPRLLLLGSLPVAWLLTFEVGRLVTRSRVPRLAAATAYVLSPPALAALVTGRLGGLVIVTMLPALVLAGAHLLALGGSPISAWRASAAAALIAAIIVAFEPPAAVPLVFVAALGLVALAVSRGPTAARRAAASRLLAAAAGAYVLLLPWSFTLFGPDSPVLGGFAGSGAAPMTWWRWLLLVPRLPGFPGAVVGAAFPGVGLLAVLLGLPRRPVAVASLAATALMGSIAAWLLGRVGPEAMAWPGLFLVISAFAYAGLLAVALSSAGEVLARHTFGWRQLLAVAGAALVGMAVGGAMRFVFDEPWTAFVADSPALPAFIATDNDVVGPFRVLVLSDLDGSVQWDLTGPEGPTMLRYGVARPRPLVDLVGGAIQEIAAGVNPSAAARLGLANVRYVYVPQGGRSAGLEAALSDQFDLEPQPVESGLVFLVRRWAPRAAYVPAAVAASVADRGELPPDAEPLALARVSDDYYEGGVPGPGTVLLAETEHRGWRARSDDGELERDADRVLTSFQVPDGSDDVTVEFARQRRRTLSVGLQALATLLAVSLLLRPPAFAEDEPEP